MAAGRAVRAFVSGRVQGVGYRASCAGVARRLGLSGYVRNCDDGRVEVVALGPPEAVSALLAWCRKGPPGAEVGELVELAVEVGPGPAGDGAGVLNGSRFAIR